MKQQQQIEQLQKIVFGSRSEKQNRNSSFQTRKGSDSEKTQEGHGRRKLPEHLPRKRVEHEPSEKDLICGECGGKKKRIGEDTSEQLEFIPASLFVIEHVVGKYACPCCGNGVTTAAKPMQPIEKGLAGPGLLAHVAVSKYGDHLPLNRQEGILERYGVDISRSTMCDWMAQIAELLNPLYEVMKKRVLRSKVIHTDDTPVRVLDRSRQKTKTARFWDYIGDRNNPYNVFDYTPDRKRDGPLAFLGVTNGEEAAPEEYTGYLHADAYRGYDCVYAGKKIIELACWAHARRKFDDARSTEPSASDEIIKLIAKLYAVESETRELASEERKRIRQERSKPTLEEIHSQLIARKSDVLPRGPLGEAVTYALSNWDALIRYIDDGDLSIDNNAAERELRHIAVGRKNWEFAGSDNGGRTAAVLYTMISSAKRNRREPFSYLRDIISRIASHPASRLETLLPDHWNPPEEQQQPIP